MAAAPRRHPHNVGGQDLSALACGTESGRLNDRIPEVIVAFLRDLASAQPDSKADLVLAAPIVSFDALLHPHRTSQCRRGRAEDHHEPVAKVLHFGPTCLGNGLAENREVTPTHLVANLGS